MREIKFRVIVHYQHGQIDIFDDTCEDWRLEFNEGHEAQLLIWDTVREGWKNCDDQFEVVQFTGLKDRNGKDVYEGDIIRVTSHGDIYTDIVKWSKAKCSFIFSDESNVEYYCADEYKQENSEVIGNIYENPELVTS